MAEGIYRSLPGEALEGLAAAAGSMLAECRVCAQECRVNRLQGEKGICRGGRRAAVASYGPHFGEENVLVGTGGSGTIFFSYCNLKCEFCQNSDISHGGAGDEVSPGELADMMLNLQKTGCHNINLVSPSHFVPQFMEALAVASKKGLHLPIIYNTGGYDSLETLRLLDGVIDIYMPDLKYGDNDAGRKYSRAAGYFDVAKEAIREMHRQVGDLKLDERGIATRGLLVRHLVLPGGLAGTENVMEFLAMEISKKTFVNLMDQYYPAYRAFLYPELKRRITGIEFQKAYNAGKAAGLTRI